MVNKQSPVEFIKHLFFSFVHKLIYRFQIVFRYLSMSFAVPKTWQMHHPVEKHVRWISRPIPYIVQYYWIKEVSNLVSRLIRWNASNYFVYKPLMELYTCLRAVLNDSEVFRHYRILDTTLEWLDELRDNLRISRKTNLKDSTPGDIDLEEVTRNIKAVLAKICVEGRELGGEIPTNCIND